VPQVRGGGETLQPVAKKQVNQRTIESVIRSRLAAAPKFWL